MLMVQIFRSVFEIGNSFWIFSLRSFDHENEKVQNEPRVFHVPSQLEKLVPKTKMRNSDIELFEEHKITVVKMYETFSTPRLQSSDSARYLCTPPPTERLVRDLDPRKENRGHSAERV